MIAFIKGTLEEIEEDYVVLESGGVGYRVFIPGTVAGALPTAGTEIKLYTYFQVREDAMVLYGFLEKSERRLFQQLIRVSGIGPKGALAILSALSADELRFAVLTDNPKAIAKAQGIGLKTAQRVVMELKDKVNADDFLSSGARQPELEQKGDTGERGIAEEAAEALTALGYGAAEAYRAVKKVPLAENMTVEDVLKQALRHMSFL